MTQREFADLVLESQEAKVRLYEAERCYSNKHHEVCEAIRKNFPLHENRPFFVGVKP